jgi:hypothetical protein
LLTEECGIKFEAILEDYRKKILKPSREDRSASGTEGAKKCCMKLYLIDNHYLLDEEVKISPYFIENYEAITRSEKFNDLSLEDKMLTYR